MGSAFSRLCLNSFSLSLGLFELFRFLSALVGWFFYPPLSFFFFLNSFPALSSDCFTSQQNNWASAGSVFCFLGFGWRMMGSGQPQLPGLFPGWRITGLFSLWETSNSLFRVRDCYFWFNVKTLTIKSTVKPALTDVCLFWLRVRKGLLLWFLKLSCFSFPAGFILISVVKCSFNV